MVTFVGDQEWYDPDGAETRGGYLVLTLSEIDPNINHNLNYRSGMLTSWNKMCFTGAYFEGTYKEVALLFSHSNPF